MYKLVICDDEGKTTIVPLIRDEVTIGRKEGNTIRLTERNVSRQHARLTRTDTAFIIEDLKSFCGTKVNGELLRGEARPVQMGDQIVIGDYNLSIRTDVADTVPLGKQMEAGDQAGIGKVTPFARLVMLNGPTPGREIELTTNLYVIGRSEEANCQIPDPSISRAHARVDGENGKWTISDLDSVNGIHINGQRRDDYLLKPGDVIELGNVKLRFVAPGEPYEYRPDREAPAVQAPPRRGIPVVAYVLGGVAVLVVAAVAAWIFIHGGASGTADDQGGRQTAASEMSFEQLVETGKDKMQSEEWDEAARLFAEALMREPDNEKARELKQTAIAEADAQRAYTAGLAAAETKNWEQAVQSLASIPRSSHYYNLSELREAAAELCREFLEMARGAARSGDIEAATRVLDQIEGIPEAPAECRDQEEKIRETMKRRPAAGEIAAGDRAERPVPGSTARASAPGDGSQPSTPPPKKGAQGGTVNPYDLPSPQSAAGIDDEKPPASQPPPPITWDPVSEARAAQQRGDTAGAIAILEKGGNGRPVLAMLAKLYQDTGNKEGYERVARKFVKLYPQDPKSDQFRKYLGEEP